jgi:hypothetical protein
LEHFKNLQGNLEFHKNKCHLRDVPDMRRQCAKATDQWGPGGCQLAKSPGWLARFYVGLARSFMVTCLHEKGKAKAVEEVGRGLSIRLAGQVAWLTGLHLVTY